MRIRTIKPEFFRHEGLQALGAEAMLVFAGLWGVADSAGRFEWRPRILKLDILPFMDFDMAEMLDLLSRAGFINHYVIDGKDYGCIPNFKEHQRISGKEAETPSRLPEPTEKQRGSNGEAIGKNFSVPVAREGKGKEGEKEGERKSAATPLPFDSHAFAEAWGNWEKHLREKKVRRTPTARDGQIGKCAEWGEARAIAALRHSTECGYTGLFEPKGSGPVPFRSPNATLPTDDELARKWAEATK